MPRVRRRGNAERRPELPRTLADARVRAATLTDEQLREDIATVTEKTWQSYGIRLAAHEELERRNYGRQKCHA